MADKKTMKFMQKLYSAILLQLEAFDAAAADIRNSRAVELKAGNKNTLTAVGDGLTNIHKFAEAMRQTESEHGMEINIPYILEQYQELLTAMQNEEYIVVADIIEFELMPMLAEWYDELEAICDPEA